MEPLSWENWTISNVEQFISGAQNTGVWTSLIPSNYMVDLQSSMRFPSCIGPNEKPNLCSEYSSSLVSILKTKMRINLSDLKVTIQNLYKF
jgi:hypothetical protein